MKTKINRSQLQDMIDRISSGDYVIESLEFGGQQQGFMSVNLTVRPSSLSNYNEYSYSCDGIEFEQFKKLVELSKSPRKPESAKDPTLVPYSYIT